MNYILRFLYRLPWKHCKLWMLWRRKVSDFVWVFCCCCVFETGSHYVASSVLGLKPYSSLPHLRECSFWSIKFACTQEWLVLAALEAPRQENAWRPGDQLGQWSGVGDGALTSKKGKYWRERRREGWEERIEKRVILVTKAWRVGWCLCAKGNPSIPIQLHLIQIKQNGHFSFH